ncbi:MAG: hypothetical protein ACLFUB_05980 [Cyclobacteriaceae bacterium]
MRKTLPNLLIAGVMLLTLSSCPGEPWEPLYTSFQPVMMKRADMEAAVQLEGPRDIVTPAKIYTREPYLLISERYKGIHIIDNRNPVQPQPLGFIRIPGCVDMAVKGNIIYADNAVDLIALDMSDLSDIKVVKRVKNAFPVLLPPDLGELPQAYQNLEEDMIIIEWRQ